MAIRDIGANSHIRWALQTSLFGLCATMTPAWAQQDAASSAPSETQAVSEEPTNDIIVTGSRIRRSGYDTVQPTTVVSGELIQQRAANSLGDVLNEQPSFGVPGQTPIGNSNSGGRVTTGQSFVNFFGLGSQRSLTLINGMRFPGANTPSANAPSPGQQVDLNMIPTALIDRVETIAVGGAPIYGADAIAGTVNVILKKRFVGFDGTITSGISDYGDAAKYRIQGLYGFDFADGRGNIILNAEYNHQDSLRQVDRPITAEQLTFQAPAAGSGSIYNNIVVRNSRAAISPSSGAILTRRAFVTQGAGARDTAGNLLTFTPDGNIIPYDIGTRAGGNVITSGGDGLNLGEFATLLGESDRYFGNIFANYDFTPELRLHLEGWVSRTEATAPANQTDYNSTSSAVAGDRDGRFNNGPYVVRLDNPFLSASARTILARATDLNNDGTPDNLLDLNGDGVRETQGFYIDKANQALQGYRPSFANQTLFRLQGALEGDFKLGGRDFSWSVAAAHGETKSDFRENATLVDRLNQAVDAVVSPTSGQIVCRDQSNGCAPLNLFTDSPSQAAINFVTADVTSKTKIKQTLFSANISGAIATLPGGDLSIATGVDYRRESSSFTPDFLSRSGQVRGFPASAVSGSYESREIYGETLIPFVSPDMDIPLIHKLSAEGAIRYVDNSLAGGDITWTAGARWAPIADIEFRGNYTRAIRAPAITELFLPNSQILAIVQDPCDTRYVSSGTNAGRRAANCAAAGIAQPFASDIASAAKPVDIRGNPNLANEEASSWTAGAIITPRFLPGFIASVDWVNIRLKNSIESLNGTTLLQSCYDSASFPTADVCQNFTRNAQGQVTSITTGYVNAGFVRFAGLTANLGYAFDIGSGRVALSANYQYTQKLDFSVTGSDLTRQAGQIGNSKHRGSANVTWTSGGLTVFGQGIYIDGAVFNNADAPNAREVRGVGDWTVFNGAIAYDVAKTVELRLTVNNLFDRDAPEYSTLSSSGISTYFAGIMGRTYAVSARVRF